MLFCNYFYYQYFKHYWNQTGSLHCKQMLTLVTVSLLTCIQHTFLHVMTT